MDKSTSEQSYFLSYILPVYKRAAVWDDNLCLYARARWESPYSYSDAMDKLNRYIVGSCSDGACSVRMYRVPPVLEVDSIKLGNIPYDRTLKCRRPHPDKVGVYLCRRMCKQDFWNDSPHFRGTPHPGCPKYGLDACNKHWDLVNSNPLYYPKWYKDLDRKLSFKGPSKMGAFIRHNTQIDMDLVLGRNYQGWPQEAKEWRTRARLWPPESVVEKVLQQGYQVVDKFCTSTGGVDGPAEHHITFALCERYLARQRTPVQKLVYLMAKTLFYTYLDLHDDDYPNIEFPSYALKTCMMWFMEQTPVDRWTDDNVPFLLRELLTHLWVSADSGILKNYFMIGANILYNCTPILLQKVSTQLACILSDTNRFLQDTALYKCNVLLYGYHVIKGGIGAYDEVVYQCQSEVVLEGLRPAIIMVHKMRAMYPHIIEILAQGSGENLHAKGYLFDEEECFHILKTMMSAYSDSYMNLVFQTHDLRNIHNILCRFPIIIDDLIENVLCLELHVPDPDVEVYRMPPQVTDVVLVQEGQDISVYKWSDIGDLIEHYIRDLRDKEAARWVPQIYSLTHRDIPELQLMDYARMLYLLYVCDDKIDKHYSLYKEVDFCEECGNCHKKAGKRSRTL